MARLRRRQVYPLARAPHYHAPTITPIQVHLVMALLPQKGSSTSREANRACPRKAFGQYCWGPMHTSGTQPCPGTFTPTACVEKDTENFAPSSILPVLRAYGVLWCAWMASWRVYEQLIEVNAVFTCV